MPADDAVPAIPPPSDPVPPDVLVRPATPADAAELARLHWDSWQATYRGILPQASFDAFPLAAREALWHSTALVAERAPDKRQHLLVAQRGAATGAGAPGGAAIDDDAQRGTDSGIDCIDSTASPPIDGFVCTGPLRPNGDLLAAPERGEVWALYLRPDAQRAGVGRALWQAAVARLQADGFHDGFVWVLSRNAAARAFYAAQGCLRVGERVFDSHGVPVDEECWRFDCG